MMVNSSFLAAALWASVALGQHVFPDCQSGPLSKNSVCDATKSPADRAKALVAAMNLQEKFNITGKSV
jgi:xylan 1,4-beta-xylosidase